MPKIDINAAPNVSSVGALRMAPAGVFSSGAGLAAAGRDITRLGKEFKVEREKEEREAKAEAEKVKRNADRLHALDIQKKIIDGEAGLTQQIIHLRETAPADANGHTDAVSKLVAEYAETFTEQNSNVSEENRAVMSVSLARMRARQVKNAAVFQAKQQAAKSVADYTEGMGQLQKMLRGGFMDLDTAIERGSMLLAASGIEAPVANKLQKSLISTLAATDVERELDDADTAHDTAALRIRADELREQLSPEMYSRVLAKIDVAEDRIRTGERVRLREKLGEEIKLARSGALTEEPRDREDFTSAFEDPRDASAAWGEYQRALGEGEDIRELRGMTSREVTAHQRELVEKSEDSSLSAAARTDALDALRRFNTAAARQQKAFKADPVTFVLTADEGVRKQLDDWRDAASAGAEEVVVNAKRDRYINSVRAAQVLRGAAPDEVVLLPPADVQAIEAALSQVEDTPEGASDLLKIFENQTTVWAASWPTVYRQLVAEEVITGGHVALARLAGDPRKNRVATELAVALASDENEYKKQLPNGATDVSDTETQIRTALAPFGQTLAGPDGSRQHAMLYQAIRQLALHRQARLGESMSDAVSYAAEKLVLEDYDVVGSYRVPKEVDRNADLISRGASAFKRYELAIYEDRIVVGAGITAEQQLSSIAANGRWVTNSDESGLMLVDEQGGPVALKDGTVVMRTWSQLQDYGGIDNTTARDPASGFRSSRSGAGSQFRKTIKTIKKLPGDPE